MSQIEPEQPQKECLPHSIWGVLSFWLAISSIAVYCAIFGSLMYMIGTSPNPETFNPKNWEDTMPPLWIIFASIVGSGCFCATFAAFILGIVGVCQPHTRKVFAYWGLFFSILPSALFLLAFVVTLFLLWL